MLYLEKYRKYHFLFWIFPVTCTEVFLNKDFFMWIDTSLLWSSNNLINVLFMYVTNAQMSQNINPNSLSINLTHLFTTYSLFDIKVLTMCFIYLVTCWHNCEFACLWWMWKKNRLSCRKSSLAPFVTVLNSWLNKM